MIGESGRRRWALLMALLAVKLHAVDPEKWAKQGKAYYEKGEYSKALQVFQRLSNENPGNPVAKEYIPYCMDKIVEAKKAEALERAKREDRPSSATVGPKDPAPTWATPYTKTNPGGRRGRGRGRSRNVRRPAFQPSGGGGIGPSPVINQIENVAEGYRQKILEGHPIEIKRKGKRVEVIAYLNRLFLPFTDTLAPDSAEEIDNIAKTLHNDPGQMTVLRAVDTLTPAVRHMMLDLPARRASILFGYLVHSGVASMEGGDRLTYKASDLDD